MSKVTDTKSKKVTDRIKALVEIKEKTLELLGTQENNLDGTLDYEVSVRMAKLNELYDSYAGEYGRINDKATKNIFGDDISYQLLRSLEKIDSNGDFDGKADVLLKPVIVPKKIISSVSSPNDALIVSLSETMRVDMELMTKLTGMSEEELANALSGQIFQNPEEDMEWESADEYLSGDVVKKLELAEQLNLEINAAALREVQPVQIPAQDIDIKLGASWIEPVYIRQFALETFNITDRFTKENLSLEYSPVSDTWNVSGYAKDWGNVTLNEVYGTKEHNAFTILEKTLNMKNITVLRNKKDEFGYVVKDVKDKPVKETDIKRTEVNQDKQEAIKRKFKEWIFADPERRKHFVSKYNRLFNNIRLRKYDGSNLNFVGMNKDISLRPHQKDAVARCLVKNSLLAHEVGCGKTYEMAAAAMEGKRLGLTNKSMVAVPKHLVQQTGDAFRKLYPNANIYVADEKDFSPENRKAAAAKIALNDWDAVIVGHTQFDRMQLSPEREQKYIKEEIDSLDRAMRSEVNENGDSSFTVKRIEEAKKRLEASLEKANERAAKDDFIDFEMLGIDKLFIDESQAYKNLSMPTKMSNVAGMNSTGSDKALQLLMKCRYMDEKTGGRGIVLSSGTPVSNSMTEMYTLMRYLAADTLKEKGLDSFDKWAKVFGETKTSMELKPTSDGKYQMRTRFANFTNLPELMTMFKDFADIKLAENLDLGRPDECEVHNVKVKANRQQRKIVKELGIRAEEIHGGSVDPTEDNMLKLTTDGRKAGLDARCFDPSLPDDPNSKVNVCIKNVYDIWKNTTGQRSTQLIFSDIATPKEPKNENKYYVFRKKSDGEYRMIYSDALQRKTLDAAYDKLVSSPPEDFVKDGNCGAVIAGDIVMTEVVDVKSEKVLRSAYKVGEKAVKQEVSADEWEALHRSPEAFYESEKRFCVYDDIKEKLVKMGVSENEIAFIHDAKTDESKVKLYDKMNNGEVRILIGSTGKCGAGMNVQKKLIALHDLDAPLRPSDMSQRHGRINRQGNENKHIDIYRYMTEKTFDAYLYQILENKQKFISQIMTEETPCRVCEDCDETVLDYAEAKALCSGNSLIKERLDLQTSINTLNNLKSSYLTSKYLMQDKVKDVPAKIEGIKSRISRLEKDKSAVETAKTVKYTENDGTQKEAFPFEIGGKVYPNKKEANKVIYDLVYKNISYLHSGNSLEIGKYKGMEISAKADKLLGGLFELKFDVKGENHYYCEIGDRENSDNVLRINHLLENIAEQIAEAEAAIPKLRADAEKARIESEKPFEYEQELESKIIRLNEVNAELMRNEKIESSPQHKLYERICDLVPQLEDPTADDFAQYFISCDGYEPLVVESRSGDTFFMSHEYKQNGDVMSDGGVNFRIDRENLSAELLSFCNDRTEVYEKYSADCPAPDEMYTDYMLKWIDDIEEQGFIECSREVWENDLNRTDEISADEQEKKISVSK